MGHNGWRRRRRGGGRGGEAAQHALAREGGRGRERGRQGKREEEALHNL